MVSRVRSGGLVSILALVGCGGGGGVVEPIPEPPSAPAPPPAAPGRLNITVATTGVDLDRFGYIVAVGGQQVGRVPIDGSIGATLAPASYPIDLLDVQSNCALQGTPPVVVLAAGDTVSVSLAVACTALPSVAGRIVWLRNYEIWTALPDMTDAQLVVPNTAGIRWGVSVSRDGKWVAYTQRLTDPNPNIMVTTFNSDAPRAVAPSSFRDQTPDWTADGRLVFVSNRQSGSNDLFITTLDGSTPQLVAGDVHHPQVSPDGTRIVFARPVAGTFDVHVMNLDGTGVTRLTSSDFYEAEPSWSPDGGRIAFIAQPDDPHSDVFVMNADGSNRSRVTMSGARIPLASPGWDAAPRWSPDGTRIVFETRRAVGWWELLMVNVNGTNETKLISESGVSHQNPILVP